ncbi:MAG: Mth938-like domain-containing protein [Lysobacteraceae bacterium]
MPFVRELSDYSYSLRFVRSDAIGVNELELTRSFYLAPDQLVENWNPRTAAELQPDDLSGLLALQPEVILLGTGDAQQFPPMAVMAACLTRGVGIEVMDNAAAARTFTVLANESRRVVAGFLLR